MVDRLEFIDDSPDMTTDPLAEIVTLLQPSASFSKLVEYAGRWRLRPEVEGKPVYFAVLEGECRLVRTGQLPIIVRAGDFVLSPSTDNQVIESIEAPLHGLDMQPAERGAGRFRVGYSSASTFSTAFTRYVGIPPMRYARTPVSG